MSVKEVNRVSILDQLKRKAMKQKKAAHVLGISVRQIRRLLKTYRREGTRGLVHKLRGIPSNNQAEAVILDRAIATVRERYHDFSVTLAHEKLTDHHGFPYSRETLRHAMMTVGLWTSTRQPIPVIHDLRDRRAAEGELVQVDGSPHAWFENRGPSCTLLVYIDDATGKLLHLAFAKSETTNAYFAATKEYLKKRGKPLALYVDRHGVFRVNATKALTARVEDSNGRTQFGRAMEELGIELIFANSPQAKGRVEKANQTLQDRLVKELRLQGIKSMEEGNRFLPKFIEEFNQKFSVVPKSPVNLHLTIVILVTNV
ncbi:ISNCY family transposase [Patescibacteria group bacterium]|nr:ISNCY family transposase [Patescibacteria group bacterium]